MAALTFDTMKLVDALEKVQIPREQARAIVDVVRDSHEVALAEQSRVAQEASERASVALDTKTERAVLRLEGEIALVRKDMQALENRLLLKIGSMLIAGFGLILAVLLK